MAELPEALTLVPGVKITDMSPAPGGLQLTDLFEIARPGAPAATWNVSASNIATLTKAQFSAGNGILYDSVGGIISASIDSTNLVFSGGKITTVQNIMTTSSPSFGGLTLNLTGSTPFTINSTTTGSLDARMSEAQFLSIAAPPTGLYAYLTDQDRIVVWDGASYQKVAWESDIIDVITDGAIGQVYFTGNATQTVISVIDTYVKVAGTFVAGPIPTANLDVNGTNGVIKNIGTETLDLIVVVNSATTMANSGTGIIRLAVFKNGVLQPNLTMSYDHDGVSPSYRPNVLSGPVSLGVGESLEIYEANGSNLENLINSDISMTVFTVGAATGAGGDLTWNDTMVNGDGTANTQPGKFFSVVSSDNLIPPIFGYNLTIPPLANDLIGSLPFLGDGSQYGSLEVYADSGTPLSASTVRFYGYSSDAPKQFMQYNGSTDSLIMTSDVSLSNNALSSIALFTQNVGTSVFNNNSGNGQFLVKTSGNALAFYMDYNNNTANFEVPVQMYSSFGVNFTLGTSIETRGFLVPYVPNVFQLVWITLDGTNYVDPNQFPIGNTVQLEVSGILESTTSGGTGVFKFGFGSVFTATSQSIDFLSTSIQRNFYFLGRITRVASDKVVASVAGWYNDPSNNMKSINIFINPDQIAYDDSLVQPIYIEWQSNVTGLNTFDCLAKNLTITQYS